MSPLCIQVKCHARNTCSQRYFCSEKIYHLHSKAGRIAQLLQCISSLLILFCKWGILNFTHKSRNSYHRNSSLAISFWLTLSPWHDSSGLGKCSAKESWSLKMFKNYSAALEPGTAKSKRWRVKMEKPLLQSPPRTVQQQRGPQCHLVFLWHRLSGCVNPAKLLASPSFQLSYSPSSIYFSEFLQNNFIFHLFHNSVWKYSLLLSVQLMCCICTLTHEQISFIS